MKCFEELQRLKPIQKIRINISNIMIMYYYRNTEREWI